MSVNQWLFNQPFGIKLAIGIGAGLIIGAGLRLLIWKANKDNRQIQENATQLNWRQKLELASKE